MLSKSVKARIARNRKIHRRPKKRAAVIARRLLELMAINIHANSGWGKHADGVVGEVQYAQLMIAKAELKARHVAEDRKYFNGWRKGYK